MEATAKEQKRAERYLQSKGIALSDIQSFCFMQRHTVVPDKHDSSNLYGPGLLTLKLRTGEERTCILHVRNHPSSLIRTLMARCIPFTNLQRNRLQAGSVTASTYRRPSLYQFWHFVLFLTFLLLAFYLLLNYPEGWTGISLSIPAFALSLNMLYLLLTRFCHLSLDTEGLSVHSIGRTVRYPFDHLLKVNFDFSREPTFTHVMEVLDKNCRYRLFYIGRTPRKSLNEIARQLRQAGIDASCSLNDEKRHYNDVYHTM
ncbi:MAG: hypothetical protein MR319_09620 [Mediterranea sp.]|nr:hypothetical protein [Mediterranea sp.]